MTPFSHILSEATRQEDLVGKVGEVVFLLGGWTLAEENWKFNGNSKD